MNPFPTETNCGNCGEAIYLRRKGWKEYLDCNDRPCGYTQFATCRGCGYVAYCMIGLRDTLDNVRRLLFSQRAN